MQHGSGRYSYALNSWMQVLAIQCLPPTLQYVVNCSKLPQDGTIHVVDLGCYCGANVLNVALVFVQMVHHKLNIFSMIFQQMISMFFSNNFHIWTQSLVEIKTLMHVLLL